jgi:hypothetical protein
MNITHEDTVEIEKKDFIKFAIEVWRLRNYIEPIQDKKFTIIRHSILNVFSLLEKEGISFVELKNQIYDAGMAVEVIDIEENPQRLKGVNVIKEVFEPLILLNGQIINQGRVILEKGMLEELPMSVNGGMND